jgi:hypothetical protein
VHVSKEPEMSHFALLASKTWLTFDINTYDQQKGAGRISSRYHAPRQRVNRSRRTGARIQVYKSLPKVAVLIGFQFPEQHSITISHAVSPPKITIMGRQVRIVQIPLAGVRDTFYETLLTNPRVSHWALLVPFLFPPAINYH